METKKYQFISATVEWNPDFSNPQFLKHPDDLNQKSFPLDLFHCNFTPDILYPNLNQFLFPLEVREISIPLYY